MDLLRGADNYRKLCTSECCGLLLWLQFRRKRLQYSVWSEGCYIAAHHVDIFAGVLTHLQHVFACQRLRRIGACGKQHHRIAHAVGLRPRRLAQRNHAEEWDLSDAPFLHCQHDLRTRAHLRGKVALTIHGHLADVVDSKPNDNTLLAMSAPEILFAGTAHAITGALIGSIVDANFPKLEDDVTHSKGGVVLGMEVLLQFGLSYLVLSETMAILLPGDNNYSSPIGDGTSITFCFATQPNFWRKVERLRRLATGEDERTRPLLTTGPNAPSGAIGN